MKNIIWRIFVILIAPLMLFPKTYADDYSATDTTHTETLRGSKSLGETFDIRRGSVYSNVIEK